MKTLKAERRERMNQDGNSTRRDFAISETCTISELVHTREQFMKRIADGYACSFSVAYRLPIRLISFAVREAEKMRDEFWQMMCVAIAGDVIGMRLPCDILRRLYRLGVMYNDWNMRSAVAMRRDLPRDLFLRLLSDPEEEVRRHFLFAHKNDRLPCIKAAYLGTLAEDVDHKTNWDYVKYAMNEALRYLLARNVNVRLSALKMLSRISTCAWQLHAGTIARCLFDKSVEVRAQAHALLRHAT
ncbi:MAG: hypothetical protein IKQ17_06655, partial [Kiritimatiellae bacterium]|nr:hypothetical protein [Kiritimatiellia bacterium]